MIEYRIQPEVNEAAEEMKASMMNRPIIQNTGVRYAITPGDGKGLQVTSKISEVSVADLSQSQGEILTTARNNGFPVLNPSHISDSTIVTVGGMSMTALSAFQNGFLSRSQDGRYSEGKKSEGLSVTEDAENNRTLEAETDNNNTNIDHDILDSNVESALDALAQDLGSYEALDRQAISIISGLASDDISYAAKGLAIATGEEPEVASEFIQGIYEGLRGQAAKYVKGKHGVDGEAVFNWAAGDLTPSEKSSLFHHVYLGQSKVLDDLVLRYRKFEHK